MMNKSTFNGFDMSALIANAQGPVTKVIEQKADLIDGYIFDMVLDKHPEVLPAIMEELGLKKFWNKLNSMKDKYSVVKPLAENRMLNFYEGATKGGLHIKHVRVGMVVCALTATCLYTAKKSEFEGILTSAACFHPKGECDLSDFDLNCMDKPEQGIVKKMVKCFSRGYPTNVQLGSDRLGEYLLNAMRMWIVSDNKKVLSVMAGIGERYDFLSQEALENQDLVDTLECGGILSYPVNEMTIFTTPWSRAKTMKLNAVARYRELVKNALQ